MGLEFPSNPVIDTLDLARRCVRNLYRYRLVDLVIHLRIAESEDHRALSDSQLVKGVFRKIVSQTKGLRTVQDLFRRSPPQGFAESGVLSIQPPEGYEELAVAIEEEHTIIMVYEGGTKGIAQRKVTPRTLLQSGNRPYLVAYCHTDQIEKTFRLDRIRELRIEG